MNILRGKMEEKVVDAIKTIALHLYQIETQSNEDAADDEKLIWHATEALAGVGLSLDSLRHAIDRRNHRAYMIANEMRLFLSQHDSIDFNKIVSSGISAAASATPGAI